MFRGEEKVRGRRPSRVVVDTLSPSIVINSLKVVPFVVILLMELLQAAVKVRNKNIPIFIL